MSPIKFGLMAAAATMAVLAVSGSAEAKGCNGYVNQLQWGCAPWDNNNGPQYPHWQGGSQSRAQVQSGARPQIANNPNPASQLANRYGNGIVAQGGGNIVAQGGGNVIAAGAHN